MAIHVVHKIHCFLSIAIRWIFCFKCFYFSFDNKPSHGEFLNRGTPEFVVGQRLDQGRACSALSASPHYDDAPTWNIKNLRTYINLKWENNHLFAIQRSRERLTKGCIKLWTVFFQKHLWSHNNCCAANPKSASCIIRGERNHIVAADYSSDLYMQGEFVL